MFIGNNTFNYISSDTIFLPSGEHNFVFIDSEGCYSDTIFIDMNPTSENCLQIPSLFTPNGDYENDLFIPIIYKNIEKSVIKIYNRWGVEVYFSQDIEKGWDGKHFSDECLEGTYFWTVEFQTNNGDESISGSVNLFR